VELFFPPPEALRNSKRYTAGILSHFPFVIKSGKDASMCGAGGTSALGGLYTSRNWSTDQWNQRMRKTLRARPCVTSTSEVLFVKRPALMSLIMWSSKIYKHNTRHYQSSQDYFHRHSQMFNVLVLHDSPTQAHTPHVAKCRLQSRG
jgi:hypothetical protein